MERTAHISDCGRYRYNLRRVWDENKGVILWILLNPSTADAETDDPTIRRLESFTRAQGFGGFEVRNVYAYRGTYPWELKRAADKGFQPFKLIKGAREFPLRIAAWGVNGGADGDRVRRIFEHNRAPLHHMGLTKAGHPRHPLYLKKDVVPEPWAAPEEKEEA